MGNIHIEGMDFYAYHGCFHEEQIIGTHFTVDLIITTDTRKAEISDQLKDTLNYQEVYNMVRHEMEQKSQLIEHVAHRIVDTLKKTFPEITAIEIKVSKRNPSLGGKVKQVAISLSV